jgi:hypothetical protein
MWVAPFVANNTKYPQEGIAFHAMCKVFNRVRNRIKMNEPFEAIDYEHTNVTYNLEYEGIFIFGGKRQNGVCTNELKILSINQEPLYWVTPVTSGQPPMPRC